MVLNNLTNYGRRHFKLFTNCRGTPFIFANMCSVEKEPQTDLSKSSWTIDICYHAEFSEFIFSWKTCVLLLTEKKSIYFRRLNTFGHRFGHFIWYNVFTLGGS